MLGSSSRRIRKASGIHVNSCPVRNPMVKHGLLGFATRRAASPAASTCDSTRRAWSRKVRPAGVNSIPRARRVSSCAPTSSSRSRICRLSDGCDVCSFARRPPSYFRLPQSQQNIEDGAAPFQLPCSQSIGASLTKYVANGALPHPTRQSISATRESEIRGAGEKQ